MKLTHTPPTINAAKVALAEALDDLAIVVARVERGDLPVTARGIAEMRAHAARVELERLQKKRSTPRSRK